MEEKEEEYTYIAGIFDVITKEIRHAISKSKKEGKALGIGIYTTKYCDTELFTHPMKSDEHRMEIASGLSGVDFVFPINTSDSKEMEKVAEEAYKKYLDKKEEHKNEKKYKVGFVIGSFDLFHAGHVENINLASELCEDLYVILKTDERIMTKKNKIPSQNTTKRAENLRALKKVKAVLFYDLDSNRNDVLLDVAEQFRRDHPEETLGIKDIVAIFGEDLQEKEEQKTNEWRGIDLYYTPRPKEKQEVVSTTHYGHVLKKTGGLEHYEQKERENLTFQKENKEEKEHGDDS